MFDQYKEQLVARKREELNAQLQEFSESLTPEAVKPQVQARFNEVTNQIETTKIEHANAQAELKRLQDEEISPLFREQEELRVVLEASAAPVEVVAVEEAPVA